MKRVDKKSRGFYQKIRFENEAKSRNVLDTAEIGVYIECRFRGMSPDEAKRQAKQEVDG